MIDLGSGAPIVLIPGLQGRWEWMRPAVEALAKHNRVVSFSLCDERTSRFPCTPSKGFTNYIDQLAAVLDRAGLASAAIALVILPRTWGLLRQAANVLLEGAPAHLDVNEIGLALSEAPGVRGVHDLHVWTLTSGREAMSAHVVIESGTSTDKILEELHILLHARFGIDHTTIQVETEPAPLLQITRP